jgi:hypothetical protein
MATVPGFAAKLGTAAAEILCEQNFSSLNS